MTQEEFQYRYEYNPKTDILGEGSFGTVYKAYDKYLSRLVAIKKAEVKYGNEKLSLKHEVDLVKELPKHINIANYEECFRFTSYAGEYDFAILQYYELGNLQELLSTNQLSGGQKVSILCQILDGIEFLHNKGIIHRDLKPQNILIAQNQNREYIPKISDFGISKKLNNNNNTFFTNTFAGGTLAYASPEQLLGQTIKKNTDLWSFGVIVCNVFLGKLPFDIGNIAITSEAGRQELYKNIAKGEIAQYVRQLPQNWYSLVEECLVVDVNKRINNATKCQELLKGDSTIIVDVVNPKNNKIPANKNKNSTIETIINAQKDVLIKPKVLTDDTVTDIDGNVYKTARIGDQIWMAENLKVSRYRNGDLIPNVTDKNKWSQLKTGAFSFYDNSIKNGTKYGNLYNWYAVDDKRCIAPKGWHVASDHECTLLKHYFTNSNVGNISKVDFIKHLGGKRNNQGTFGFINQDGSFWSSNEGGNNPIPLGIFQIPGDLWNSKPGSSSYAYAWSWSNCIDFTNKVNGLSIRCVKDTNQELSLKDKRIISAAKEVRERRKKMPIRFVIALIVSIVIIYIIGIIFYNSTSESMNRFFYIFGGVIIFGLFSKWIGNN